MTIFEQRKQSYKKRADLAQNLAAQKLFQLMEEKETNLTSADDLTDPEQFLEIADKVGPEICVLKTHIDILENFTPRIIDELVRLSEKHNFLIFEDRKFADIGNTVKMQYEKGVYRIVEWAHLTNAHAVPGPGVIEGLFEVAKEKIDKGIPRGCLLLAQMSSSGTLATEDYTKKTVEMAKEYTNFVCGFIGVGSNPQELKKLAGISGPEFILMTPGVKLEAGGDSLKQTYATPKDAMEAGSDSIIVGRGIYQADDPQKAAQEYRKLAWEAYLERIK